VGIIASSLLRLPWLHPSDEGVAGSEVLRRVGAQDEAHLDAAHQFALQFGHGAAGHVHCLVELDAHHHVIRALVVVVDAAHDAHGVTVGIDGVGYGQPVDVVKLHVVGVAGGKDVDAFQKLMPINNMTMATIAIRAIFTSFVRYFITYLIFSV